MPPSPSPHLCRLLFRCLTAQPPNLQRHCHLLPLEPSERIARLSSLASRFFCSVPSFEHETRELEEEQVSSFLAKELLSITDPDLESVSQSLQLTCSHLKLSPELILQTLNLTPEAGRRALGFNHWLVSNSGFTHTDETVSFFVDYFGRRKDFKAVHDIIADNRSVVGAKTLESAIDRLVRAGRPTQVTGFFDRMEKDYGFKRDRDSLTLVVERLCDKGFASYAEKLVKNVANEIFPDENICDLLIKGWCVDGKLDDALRLAAEMYRGGFEIGTTAYNAILDCVCKLCRKKDPFRLQSEAESVLREMDYRGVPRNTATFNVLINNLCKIRRTEEAMTLYGKMGEWGCSPDAETYLLLIRSLYQAARVGEGDEMIDRMKSAGFSEALDKKAYYGFLKILCGIERLDHSMTVFKRMKVDRCKPGIKTYELLMEKWCAHKRLDRANALYRQALKIGLPVSPREYRVDPRFLKKKTKNVKNERKRETLPEKMARKRRRLKQIRLSFVKKPTRMMRRAV